MTRSLLPILALVLLFALPAIGEDDPGEAPALIEPLPFEHTVHDASFESLGLTCIDCHPVGLRAESGKVEDLPVPKSICHSCHLAELEGLPRKAARTCSACHADREQLKPGNHGVGWETDHCFEARRLRSGCGDCHDPGQCIDCHDARGAQARMPHAPGFRSLHGVEAKFNGARCVTCHAAETCVRCHETGSWPW